MIILESVIAEMKSLCNKIISEEAMYKFSLCIASYFCDHQVVFGVNSDTNHFHTHFMVNTVSFRVGSVLKGKIRTLRHYKPLQ